MTRKTEMLTPHFVKTAPIGLHNDGLGLYLQVRQSTAADGGITRSWVYRYKVGRKQKHFGLGPLAVVSLAEGRRQATLQRSARGGAFFNPAGLELAAFAPGERGTVLTFAAALEGNPFARMALLGATLAVSE